MMTGGYPVQVQVPGGGYQYQPQVPAYGQQQVPPVVPGYPPPLQIQPQYGNKQRKKRSPIVRPGSGLSIQTGTGSLAPSLILSNDTIDIIFPVHWIYPPKIDVLQKQDIDCIKYKLSNMKDQSRIDEDSEEFADLIKDIEEECLKKSGNYAKDDAVYETPSDYNPLSINMGQMIVYRFVLRCKCKSSNLGYGENCARILPYEQQGWSAHMGSHGDSIYRTSSTR